MTPGVLHRAAALALAAATAAAASAPARAAEPVAEADMLRWCQGEAAARFDVSPQSIRMGDLDPTDNDGRLAHGRYRIGDAKAVKFLCRYSPKGVFRWVRTEDEQAAIAENRKQSTKANGGATPRQVRACNAVEDRYGEVVETTPLKPGAFELILQYDDGRYVCDVEENGKVTFFEKLR
ncbi:hypothetical protein [Albimonas pacifica]|uniref:Peptidase propeptide and YPEB domain-containing protein n=1 Tax=Albimonas pacifica TaxID=1114924 RepID=A0A1I3CXT1_9RHOB|nr:hypothetical protein [Albimonas pacifica]SFH79380.1 hypothetical protein SAMN05216258_102277 [Albimonas pacifica]